jgi:hypothetical protein
MPKELSKKGVSEKDAQIQIGYDFEMKVFGMSSKGRKRPYPHLYEHALSLVKQGQKELKWDSLYPKTEIAKKLFDAVKLYLPRELSQKLNLFCAIGTSLDRHYGIDGFFAIEDVEVTFDLATYYKKEYRSDFLITPYDLTDEHLWKLGRDIAQAFKQKIPMKSVSSRN